MINILASHPWSLRRSDITALQCHFSLFSMCSTPQKMTLPSADISPTKTSKTWCENDHCMLTDIFSRRDRQTHAMPCHDKYLNKLSDYIENSLPIAFPMQAYTFPKTFQNFFLCANATNFLTAPCIRPSSYILQPLFRLTAVGQSLLPVKSLEHSFPLWSLPDANPTWEGGGAFRAILNAKRYRNVLPVYEDRLVHTGWWLQTNFCPHFDFLHIYLAVPVYIIQYCCIRINSANTGVRCLSPS